MRVSAERVLMAPAARLDGTELLAVRASFEGLEMPGSFPAGADVADELRRRRAEDPVPDGAVTTSNLADAGIDPAEAFDPSSGPVDVARGGTGLAHVPEGALLVGRGTGPVQPAASVSFSGGDLHAPSLEVGAWALSPGSDELGRRTLHARDSASGEEVDLLRPGPPAALPPPTLSVEVGASGQATLVAAAADPLARLVHFDWRPAPSAARTRAQMALTPGASVVADPGGGARYTATGLAPATAYDFRAATEDGRGNVGPVAEASATTAAP